MNSFYYSKFLWGHLSLSIVKVPVSRGQVIELTVLARTTGQSINMSKKKKHNFLSQLKLGPKKEIICELLTKELSQKRKEI